MGAVLMALYFHFWFIPLHGLSLAAEVFIGIGLAMQLIMAWVPDYDDSSQCSRIHRGCTYVMGISMALFMFIASYNTHGIARLGFGIASLLLTLYAIVFQTQKALWRNFLLHQSLFFTIFLATVLALGYFAI
ncbi:hypothetical protein JNM87_01615 [Candidatus Saccharibacteria bacterium]|nr:hypothetical protein [Candidatus Saccharibacteria bacterium]